MAEFPNMAIPENCEMADLLGELTDIAPAGYAAGLHIRSGLPAVYHSTYPADWVQHYNDNSYFVLDPLIYWGGITTGLTRWSNASVADPFKLFEQAAEYGLQYGAAASHGPLSSRSIVGIGRADREFSDVELSQLHNVTVRLHDAACPPDKLTSAQTEALQCIAQGERCASAAVKLGISESALKARLKSARIRLGACTTSDALTKARELGVL